MRVKLMEAEFIMDMVVVEVVEDGRIMVEMLLKVALKELDIQIMVLMVIMVVAATLKQVVMVEFPFIHL